MASGLGQQHGDASCSQNSHGQYKKAQNHKVLYLDGGLIQLIGCSAWAEVHLAGAVRGLLWQICHDPANDPGFCTCLLYECLHSFVLVKHL